MPPHFAGRGTSLTDFKFTPAAGQGPAVAGPRRDPRARRPLRRARSCATASADSTVSALTPTSYNLGVAVGWKRFAVAGDVAKVKEADPALGGRESAVVGVSYSLKKFTGRVAVGAERGDGRALAALRKRRQLLARRRRRPTRCRAASP